MDLGLTGKVALVAASSQGLGRAVAEELASEGASLIMCARGSAALEAACRSIRDRTGLDAIGVTADLSVLSDLGRVYQQGIERFGRVDILVTNSGGPRPGTFDTLTREDWDRASAEVLMNVVEMCRLCVPGMKERGWGRILNITSIAAKQPVENLMLSNSLRAAVTGFAKSLALEVAPFGVTVNNILPGYTSTDRVVQLSESLGGSEGVDPAGIRARWEGEIPMRRLGRPDEFAALAAFLVSERAGYITGSSVAVDGGWIRSLL